ncbi:MAG: Gfo/Idh/MocA family oxidoreductase [Phycisphaerae bacterium]|nr:Gfo/Idh/MocA family oxidoreductase [Phycisphaerae bacterium]
MAKKLGAAIMGAGWVSGEHVRAYQANPNVDVVAVGSRRLATAKAKAAELGLDVPCYEDYDKLLADPNVDIVSVCSPGGVHVEQGVKAAQAGKHVLMEKPMCVDLDGAKKLRDAVAKAGVRSVVSFVLRWNPLINIIKNQLADNAVGKIMYGEFAYFHAIGPWYPGFEHYCSKEGTGNAMLCGGCHAVDAMRYFMQDKIVEVTAYSTRSDEPPFDKIQYDPTIVAICRWAGGAVTKVACSFECNCPYMFDILLMGTKGTIRDNRYYGDKCLGTFGHPEIGRGQYDWVTWPTILPDSGDVSHHPFQGEIDHLVECIQAGRESHVNVADAYDTHELCIAATLSAERGEPVKLPL